MLISNAEQVVQGGTGYGPRPRYRRLLNISALITAFTTVSGTAYGFPDAGCPRQCPFCIVSGKRGGGAACGGPLRILDGQKEIKLLDPICWPARTMKGCCTTGRERALVDFTQGLDHPADYPDHTALLKSADGGLISPGTTPMRT